MHEPARPGRIDQKPAPELNGLAASFSLDVNTIRGFAHP